ncbi:uncharacterized protein JCM6883_001926 [Sporobolomyces salmoneus]|uniref:uncharacterized protein n=1 Tax=Sporobolomyces salmoneus TaxID=183962 RepID=UPI00317A99C0
MDRLQHLFESAAKLDSLPDKYKAAQFTAPTSALTINEVAWIEPKEGGKSALSQVVVKVSSCGLYKTDRITKHNLLPHLKYPITPGSFATGSIVQIGHNVKKLKLNEQVIGVAAHAQLRRFEEEEKRLSKDEHRRISNANERLGFPGEGVNVVIGDGGSARVAAQVLKHSSTDKDQRVIVITSNEQWDHSFYDVEEGDHLKFSQNELASALKSIGGIRFAVAVSQPQQYDLEQILEAMRYSGELIVLAPHHEHKVQVPLAPVIAKSLSLRGAVWPDRLALEKALELVHKGTLHLSVNLYKFNEDEVNKAWNDLEGGTKFDQPIIVFE